MPIQVEQTEIPAVWSLTVNGQPPYPSIDTMADTGLLRHRPASAASLSWFQTKADTWIFQINQGGLVPLTDAVRRSSADPRAGFLLMIKMIEAIEETIDHLLPVIPELLRPDLLYVSCSANGRDVEYLQIVTLPLLCPEQEAVLVDAEIVRWFGAAFHWDSSVIRKLKDLYEREAFFDLLLELKSLAGEPLTAVEKQREKATAQQDRNAQDIHTLPQSEEGRNRLLSHMKTGTTRGGRIAMKIKELARMIFGVQNQEMIHEATEELDLSSDQFQIAQLSQGLPGTPEEEIGHHAYILTEEFVIGRDMSKCDLWIDSPSISRQHAKISRHAGSYFLEDLGSTNGTTLDGLKLTKNREYLLPEKCRVGFAHEVYYFRSG